MDEYDKRNGEGEEEKEEEEKGLSISTSLSATTISPMTSSLTLKFLQNGIQNRRSLNYTTQQYHRFVVYPIFLKNKN